MRTVSLRWPSTWNDRGRAPQRWSRRCVSELALMFIMLISSSVDFVVGGEIPTTAYVDHFCIPCILCKHNILHTVQLICSLIHLNSYSGGMTRPQPPTCCCCQRSRGANLSACALNQHPPRMPALHCTRDYRSDSGPQPPKGFVLILGCWLFGFLFFHRLLFSLSLSD